MTIVAIASVLVALAEITGAVCWVINVRIQRQVRDDAIAYFSKPSSVIVLAKVSDPSGMFSDPVTEVLNEEP